MLNKTSTLDHTPNLQRDAVVTFVICLAIALLTWAVGGGESFWLMARISFVYGMACLLGSYGMFYCFRDKLGRLQHTVVGCLFGVLIGSIHLLWTIYGSFAKLWSQSLADIGLSLVFGVLFSLIVSYFFYSKQKLDMKEAELQEQKLRAVTQEKDLVEANFQVLQSQMEPHFLFNTLATIQVLIDLDPKQAKQILEHFTGLLRASLTRTRKSCVHLSEEMDIVKAYLAIQKVRMGDRLTYEIRFDDSAKDAQCPPFSIQPLVENAVIHGLEPSLTGGHICIDIRSQADNVCVLIEDTGLGLAASGEVQKTMSNGIGLANIKQRFELLYGDHAQVKLTERATAQDATATGCCVTVRWPYVAGQID